MVTVVVADDPELGDRTSFSFTFSSFDAETVCQQGLNNHEGSFDKLLEDAQGALFPVKHGEVKIMTE